MEKTSDCIVCGTCVADVLVCPVTLDSPIGSNRLWHVNPLVTTGGGIVCNAGTAMARLGMQVAAFSKVGKDAWGDALLQHFQREGINIDGVLQSDIGATGATAVLIGVNGERSFAHHLGLAATVNARDVRANFRLFARSRVVLIGHYALLPALEPDLRSLLRELQAADCLTVLDPAAEGGDTKLLFTLIPHLDFYIPSFAEASQQTGESDPERIIAVFRSSGAKRVIGVKLGSRGALLSPAPGRFLEVGVITPPGAIRDTTGAGDAFLGGLLTALLNGLEFEQASRLAAATSACCLTGFGATAGLRNWKETAALAEVA